MTEAAIKKAVEAIVNIATDVDRTPAEPAQSAQGVYIPCTCEKQTLEEALNTVSLHVRYLMFDLEATRRENRYLRQIIDTRPRPEAESDGDR